MPQLLKLGRHRQLLHHQGQLVARRTAFQPTCSGGKGSMARASSRTPSTTRMVATMASCSRTPTSRPGGTSSRRRCMPPRCSLSAMAMAVAARRPKWSSAKCSCAISRCSPKARWGHVADYFAEAHEHGDAMKLPVWDGEIYLELHRATLTTQSGVKRMHRQAERALITAETAASLAHHAWVPAPRPRSSRIGASCSRTSSTTSCRAPPSAKCIRTPSANSAASSMRGKAAQAGGARCDRRRSCRRARAMALLVVNPSLSGAPRSARPRTPCRRSGSPCVPSRSCPLRAGLYGQQGASRERRSQASRSAADGTDRVASSTSRAAAKRSTAPGNQLWAYPVDKPRNWDAWDVEEDYRREGRGN